MVGCMQQKKLIFGFTPSHESRNLQLPLFFMYLYDQTLLSTVVIQPYETDVGKEYVILGNDALMKCQIPSFVADSVSVFSWTSSEDELKSYTHENSQGNN